MKQIKMYCAIILCVLLCAVFATACGAGSQNGSADTVPADSPTVSGQAGSSGDDANASVGSIARTGDDGGGDGGNSGSNGSSGSEENSGSGSGGGSGNGSGSGGDSGSGSGSGSSSGGAPEPAPLSMAGDMGIGINGQWYPIWQDAGALLRALGDDYVLSAAASCVFDGEDKEFAYEGCFVFTNPDGDRDIWYSILLENDAFTTSRGIRVGSALEDVMAAYGDKYYWEGDDILTYSISGEQGDIASPCILFTLEDEHISSIEIYYPTNVT